MDSAAHKCHVLFQQVGPQISHCAAHGQYIFRKLNAKLLDDILPTHLHPLPHLRVLLADLLLQSLIGQHHGALGTAAAVAPAPME